MAQNVPIYSPEAQSIVVGGRYRHYKGGNYKVLMLARMEATLKEVVIYRSDETGHSWVRPVTGFLETVDCNGQRLSRFQRLDGAIL